MKKLLIALRAIACCAAMAAVCLANGHAVAGAYTLVEGLEKFQGSTAAWNLLESNGFVVADPTFKQIFQPYVNGPLPCFITPDSAWHTYHLLMEEGLQQLETAQSRRLTNFSRQLWRAATEQAKSEGQDFADIAAYAAVAIALQEAAVQSPPSRGGRGAGATAPSNSSQPDSSLSAAARAVVAALRAGSGQADPGIGFPLSAAAFRAPDAAPAARGQGGNAGSRELSGYFAARQWYATVVFRLSDPRETRLALCLAWLIAQDPDLLREWKQLSNPYDALRAPAEGGTLPLYLDTAKGILGADFTPAALGGRLADLQKALAKQLPASRLNDQLLPSGQSAQFGELTRGFRLFPPRLLPDELCFAAAVAPKTPGRSNPSGLDFMAGAPELRSPAAARALRLSAGDKAAAAAQKADAAELPDSIYGEEIRLLGKLQQPFPASAAPAFRSAAWADAQLWTQLGAWAEQRHSGASTARMMIPEQGQIMLPGGVVAPYPAFFAGLAGLSREAAGVLEKSVARKPFDPQGIAKAILASIPLWRGGRGGLQNGGRTVSDDALQFSRFWARYWNGRMREEDPEPVLDDLQSLAQHCATNPPSDKAPTDKEMKTLVLYYESDPYAPAQLKDFAAICDRLSQLARRTLAGTSPTEEDQEWIRGYGATIASFDSYPGDTFDNLRDDFPILSRVFVSPAGGPATYAGVARPLALYIILPSDGKLRLFRGAVFDYREFSQTGGAWVDDAAWRRMIGGGGGIAAMRQGLVLNTTPMGRMIGSGGAPAPPAFTASFFAEKTAADLIAELRASFHSPDDEDRMDGMDSVMDVMDQLGSRVSDADLPALINLLAEGYRNRANEFTSPLTELIGTLNWRSNQPQLLQIIGQTDDTEALNSIASMLLDKKELDTAFLSADFAKEPPRLRRFYCFLLSSVPAAQPAFDTLARAMTDPDDSVRWQAALAMSKPIGNDSQKQSLLLGRLDDANEFVAAAAAYSLSKNRSTNLGPLLLDKLNRRLSSPPPSAESLRQQAQAIVGINNMNGFAGGPSSVMDQDGLEARLRQGTARLRVNTGVVPAPFTLVDSIVEILGTLRYRPAEDKLFTLLPGDYDVTAAKALFQLAPDRIATRIITNVCDRNASPNVRDRLLSLLPDTVATNHIADLSPLLDDTNAVPSPAGFVPSPNVTVTARGTMPVIGSGQWRMCDRAAIALSPLLGGRRMSLSPSLALTQRDQFIVRVRDAVKKVQAGEPVPKVQPGPPAPNIRPVPLLR